MADGLGGDIAADFDAYVSKIVRVIGHADRAEPLRDYCSGLLLPLDRKSVEPLAAAVRPDHVSAKHQSLLHFVGQSNWSDNAVLACVREQVLPVVERDNPVEAWIIDDTGSPKKGKHSVGVARQYCGQHGKTESCQVIVSLSVATEAASLPVAHRLFLPESWAKDPVRRKEAKIPDDIVFQTKSNIALDLIKSGLAQDIPRGTVLADAGFGGSGEFRAAVTALGLIYAMAVRPLTNVWRKGEAPPKKLSKGRPGPYPKGQPAPPPHPHRPLQVQKLALELPASKWRTITWREGSNTPLSDRFAILRVSCANGDGLRAAPSPEEWLIIEWPKDEEEPTRYWLSTLPADTSPTELVRMAKLRWRIERDYLELKQECGLGQYEGRGWRGFHHHVTLCIAAYGFLISQAGAIPPCATRKTASGQKSPLPRGHSSRKTADPARTTRPEFNRNADNPNSHRNLSTAPKMSVL
jgi:SRSO17 transposase